MHDYNTILGVIELRLSKVSYDSVQKRYRILLRILVKIQREFLNNPINASEVANRCYIEK